MERALAAIGVASIAGLMAFAPLQSWNEEWRMKPSSDNGKVHFTIERTRPGSRWVHSSDVGRERFEGLPAQAPRTSGEARFEFTGDAGRIVCTGTFAGGIGRGSYQFVPDRAFGSKLQALGYDAPSEDHLFSMMMADVSLNFARAVKTAGVSVSTRDLYDMRIHGITAEYIGDMRDTGYKILSGREYIDMKIHGVSPDLVRELKAAGYDVPARSVIEMKIHGVSPEYIRELKTYGLRPDAKEVVQMKIHGVQPEYLKGFRDAGYGQFEVKEVIDMRTQGVSPEFAQEAVRLGFKFTAKELMNMRNHGVDAQYLNKLKTAGFDRLTADKIVQLRVNGID